MPSLVEVAPEDPDFCSLQADRATAPARCLLARREGLAVARASFEVADDLHGAPGPTGMVGHYEARDGEAGVAVLREAVRRLAALGALRVLGPMNGSTWARYRVALPAPEAFDPPWFFGEPRNPPEHALHFAAAGFVEDALYESRVAEDLEPPPGLLDRLARRLEREGFRERCFDPSQAEEDLASLHGLSLSAFADNLYYRPLPAGDFLAQYRPLVPVLDPDLVRLVTAPDGSLAAFVLAYPDFAAEAGTRVVLKTLASSPRWRNRGLGSLLTARVHDLARQKGYRSVIHALMHVANASVRISGNLSGARVFRRYVLFRRDLDEAG